MDKSRVSKIDMKFLSITIWDICKIIVLKTISEGASSFCSRFLQIQFPNSLARKKGSVQQNNVASTDEVCVGFEIFICDTHFALCMNPHTNVSGPSWNFPDRVSIMLRPIKTNFMNVREYFSAWIILVSFLNYLWRRQVIRKLRSKPPCYEGLKSEVAWICSNHGFLIHRFFQ